MQYLRGILHGGNELSPADHLTASFKLHDERWYSAVQNSHAYGGKALNALQFVIPALPGSGVFTKPTDAGWGVGRTASD